MAKLVADETTAKRFVEAFRAENADEFKAILDEFALSPFCHIICFWLCFRRCHLFCRLVCPGDLQLPRGDLLDDFRVGGEAFGKLASDPDRFATALQAYDANDVEQVQAVINELNLFPFCLLICHWFCVIRCHRVCWKLCEIPRRGYSIQETAEFLRRWQKLAISELAVDRLIVAIERQDRQTLMAILEEFGLSRFCHVICVWLCCAMHLVLPDHLPARSRL